MRYDKFYDKLWLLRIFVTIQEPLFREGFVRSKILSFAGKNTNDRVDLEWIFARNCEGTEQLPIFNIYTLRKILYKPNVFPENSE